MTEPILLLGITEIGQSVTLRPYLTNSQHIHKLTITDITDGTLDLNQFIYVDVDYVYSTRFTLLLFFYSF